MPTPRVNVEEQLRRLAAMKTAEPSDEMRELVRQALKSKLSYVVVRGAHLASQKRLRELIPDLLAAFDRHMAEPGSDRGCEAMTSIVRALHELDHDDAEVFLRGIRHMQPEGPVVPHESPLVPDEDILRPADTAIPLRAASVIALARQRRPAVLLDLMPLLVDKEYQVRAAAAQAIAATGRHEGQLLLRLKVLVGDREPEVMIECFSALLLLAGRESLDFVAGYLDSASESTSEAAALALGASRVAGAFDALRARWKPHLDSQSVSVLLTAIAMLRDDRAMEFLLSLIRTDSFETASAAIVAMKSGKSDPRVRSGVEAAVTQRGDVRLLEVLKREFGA
ncbi:MAG: hypothetical protein ACHRHE_15530 [Tepidisphaerales bacterium]